jgi:hypothetical protein
MVRLIIESVLILVGVGFGAVIENKYGPVKAIKEYFAAHFGKPAGE